MQWSKAISGTSSFSKYSTLFFISAKVDAPVDKRIGFLYLETFFKSKKLFKSDDEILKKGTIEARKLTALLSKGVEIKSIFIFLECFW